MKHFKNFFKRLLPIFAIVGPGIIAGSADNDAGGITTYSLTGAHFGYSMLWVLFLTTFALAATQEVGARMGLVTGKGLASLIREKFGVRWTTFIMGILLVANIGTIAAEFAGIATAFEIFHISKFISIPLLAFGLYFLLLKGNFKKLEHIFLAFSAFYLVYIISAIYAKPDWGFALKSLIIPNVHTDKNYFLTMIAVIGTTITPWGQFFIQDYVVDKKLTKEDLHVEQGDVFFGAFITNFISFFIIVACAATIFIHQQNINSAKDAALALQPLVGNLATFLFGFGLLNASLFGAAIVPMSTSYVITEAFGFESGLDFTFHEAKAFYILLALLLGIGALLTLNPVIPLLSILFVTQAINAVLLLPILVFIYLLSNDKKLLGEYANNKGINFLLMIIFSLIAISSIIYFVSLFIS